MKTLFFLAVIRVLCAANTGNPGSERNHNISDSQYTVHYISEQSVDLADSSKLNGKWYLLPVLAADTATGKLPVLEINQAAMNFSGNTGCNSMRGSFQKTDSSFSFNKNIITTKMMCTGYDEAAFLKNLLRTNRYKIEAGELILMFDATELSRWTRKPGGPPKVNKA